MSQDNYTTEKKKYKHLKESERYKIEGYLQDRKKPHEIAVLLGKSTRTIQREIKRGRIEQIDSQLKIRKEYKADYAQGKYRSFLRNKGSKRKLEECIKLRDYIEGQILERGYSPDVAVGRIAVEGVKFETCVCTKTVYSAIEAGIFIKLSNRDLPEKQKRKKRDYRRIHKVAHNNTKGTSIEERPAKANERAEYGHWEMDLVVSGRGAKAALMTLTERMTREEIILKIWDKSQDSVRKAMDKMEREIGPCEFRKKFRTITVDNGSEFLDFKALEKSIGPGRAKPRTKLYYAHPYSSWERGSNENQNRMIRRRVPKGCNIGRYSRKQIKEIQDWMNNYPRRILGYKTPREAAEASFGV